ncbi:hypothetical protein Tsubulata_028507 [Turnera subulata]|uniref:Uncharacterized protein n=1 Tax=Turnera subulata TaxID=218843 RepID=A0A9Q0FT81_9ROSI|nr:hypothetical protein Tsubulata_028507 [Turnera subulata]
MDDLLVSSLCKFTTLLNPSSVEEPVPAFGDDAKARMATVTVFTIANRYGDYIRTGWRNILDCILRLHKLGLLPARVASDAADESEVSAEPGHGKPLTNSLSSLARALIWAVGPPQKGNSSPEDEDTAVLCLELLIAITLNNRDRIVLLWQGVYEHIANIVQSLQLVLKLDARAADAYCEQITQEVSRLVKANATHIRSLITARHPEASEAGFDALMFIMSDGANLLPANYVLCVDAVSCGAGRKEAIGEEESAEFVTGYWGNVVEACAGIAKGMLGSERRDDLLEIASGHQKDYRNMEGTLIIAVKLLSKVFLQLLHELSQLTTFSKLWLGVLSRMEKYLKVKANGKKNEKLQEVVPELLKRTLVIAPSLQNEVFADQDWEQSHNNVGEIGGSLVPGEKSSESMPSEIAGAGG